MLIKEGGAVIEKPYVAKANSGNGGEGGEGGDNGGGDNGGGNSDLEG